MADICFHARFEDSAGDGVDGLTVTWNVNRITRSTAAYFAEVTGGPTTTAVGRDGLYVYLLTGANLVLYDYTATAITASATPTVHEVAAVWTLWALSWHDIATSAMTLAGSIGKLLVDNIDGAISDIPAAVWSVATATLTGVGSIGKYIVDNLAGTAIAAAVWNALTVTYSAAGSFGAAIVNICSCVVSALTKYGLVNKAQSGVLDMYRGDTWVHRFYGLGDLTGNDDIWFGVKADKNDTDAEAIILISRTVGLERINGAAATVPANGSITVIGALTDGVIEVELDEIEMAKLTASKKFYYDVQKRVSGDTTSPECGTCIVSADVVRATS